MSQVETLHHFSLLVVGRPHHLRVYVQGGHRHQSDVELQGHCEVGPHVALEVVLVVGKPAEVLSVVAHGFAKFFGVVDLF